MQALDLKPNYMRAWTNMGISRANLADYEGSAKFYVRCGGWGVRMHVGVGVGVGGWGQQEWPGVSGWGEVWTM